MHVQYIIVKRVLMKGTSLTLTLVWFDSLPWISRFVVSLLGVRGEIGHLSVVTVGSAYVTYSVVQQK